jgi:starch synthase
MKVLFVASECAPFVKTGGLADVVSALPKALAGVGVDAKVMLPAYPALAPLAAQGRQVARLTDFAGRGMRLLATTAEGLDLLLLEAPHLYDRAGNPYLDAGGADWPDNDLRFGVLSAAAAQVARNGTADWSPDLLHAHDWQAGLAPAYLAFMAADGGGRRPARSVMTIHNVAFQGLFPGSAIPQLGLPPAEYRMDGYEFHGQVGFLKAGLVWADAISTVSPTYARELMAPEFGMGLEGLLAHRRRRLYGILNGVETAVWDPAADPALPATYGPRSLERRRINKGALLERFGLDMPPGAPLFCVISRLTRQKGLDLLLEALPRLLARGAGLLVLGSGDTELEEAYQAAAAAHPNRIGVEIGYDEPLAHLMQGGADAILVPSRFEPCGLTQLYGLRYGCIPVVARTGGLADSVVDANEAALATGVATGFQFSPVTARALADALDRACDAFADRALWRTIVRRAMGQPVGWERAAAQYRDLYAAALEG